jgi:hypothetical protein
MTTVQSYGGPESNDEDTPIYQNDADGNPIGNERSRPESSNGMSREKKAGIGAGIIIGILVVITIIVLIVLAVMGKFSSSENKLTGKDIYCPAPGTLTGGICVCPSGYVMTALDGKQACQPSSPNCTSSQDLYGGQCVAKCATGKIHTASGCACPPGSSGTNCMVVESISGVPVTAENGYSICRGNGLVWNGYKCLNTNNSSTCPLTSIGNIECKGERNVYWIHDSASTDPYQCYNGIDTSGGRVYGQSGSYSEPTDRCMFGLNGATDVTSCNNLKTALKC